MWEEIKCQKSEIPYYILKYINDSSITICKKYLMLQENNCYASEESFKQLFECNCGKTWQYVSISSEAHDPYFRCDKCGYYETLPQTVGRTYKYNGIVIKDNQTRYPWHSEKSITYSKKHKSKKWCYQIMDVNREIKSLDHL